jgi:hypothetical protein
MASAGHRINQESSFVWVNENTGTAYKSVLHALWRVIIEYPVAAGDVPVLRK